MIQAANVLAKSNRKPASFPSNYFYRRTRAFLDELYVRHLEQEHKKYWFFVVFAGKTIQVATIVTHLLTSLLITIMRRFDYDARNKPERLETKDEIYRKPLQQKVKQYFSASENASSNRGVLCERVFQDTPKKDRGKK